jgi:DNA polymerase elongation subunit (family B)
MRVVAYYPAIVVNNQLKPAHLSDKLLKSYEHVYRERIKLKPLGKKDKKIQGIVEAYKLLLNSCFGKFGSMTSWLYDAQTMFSVTLTGELSLLMLIEMFEENGINVISANSDGVTTRFHKSKLELKNELVKQWQQLTNFEIETVRFKWFYYLGVNSYIACTDSNKYKFKNDFVSDVELYKNPSKRIIPLALQQYFINGVKPEDFITNHKDILDFCIRGKANSSTSLFLKYDNGESIDVGSLIRYYLTKDKNSPQLFKIGEGSKDNSIDANQNAPNELGIQRVKLFNKIVDGPYNIDYEQYIYQTYKIIAKIEKNKKDLNYVDSILNKDQFKLF